MSDYVIAPTLEDFNELYPVYLSRLMFNQFVGWPPETRSFEEFVRAARFGEKGAQE